MQLLTSTHTHTHTLPAQTRTAQFLLDLLRRHKKVLRGRLVVPWRPLYDLLMVMYGDPQPKLEGGWTPGPGTITA